MSKKGTQDEGWIRYILGTLWDHATGQDRTPLRYIVRDDSKMAVRQAHRKIRRLWRREGQ